MYVVFHSNFAEYIVCRRYKPCEFLGFVWTDCRGNKSYYVITSLANRLDDIIVHQQRWGTFSFELLEWTTALSDGFLLLWNVAGVSKAQALNKPWFAHPHHWAKNSGNCHDVCAHSQALLSLVTPSIGSSHSSSLYCYPLLLAEVV